MLWFAVAGAIEIIIHLLNRQRYKKVSWAAMEFLLTAERFPAERALELGLLNEIVPEEQLMEKVFEWAARITANAPLAVQATKESVMQGLALDLEEAFKFESKIAGQVFQTEDAKEGPKAFAEKREPKWQAR